MKANPSRPRWQALAQALLPELHERFGAEETWKGGGAMPFFFELLAATRQAHLAGDEAFLLRAYAFAHWCMAQSDRELWNSAGVGFFEHLFDGLPPDSVVPWIGSDAFHDIVPLIEARLGSERARKIRKRFEARKETLERNYASVIERAQHEIGRAS